MAARTFMRGHEVYYDGENWRYSDDDTIADDSRPCKRCGHYPTKDGYDHCIGHIDGVTSACCGHGVENPYTQTDRGRFQG